MEDWCNMTLEELFDEVNHSHNALLPPVDNGAADLAHPTSEEEVNENIENGSIEPPNQASFNSSRATISACEGNHGEMINMIDETLFGSVDTVSMETVASISVTEFNERLKNNSVPNNISQVMFNGNK